MREKRERETGGVAFKVVFRAVSRGSIKEPGGCGYVYILILYKHPPL